MLQKFSETALLLLGHGTHKNSGSEKPVLQHAAAIRKRQIFAEVFECFWKQDPGIDEVISACSAPRLVVVPFFVSEGYFCETIIPRHLGLSERARPGAPRIRRSAEKLLLYTTPVGTHGAMTGVLLARARQVIWDFPFPRAPREREVSLFIAGHGTEQSSESRASVDEQVRRLREKSTYAQVESIFLDQEPRIPSCYSMAATRNLVVVPFFMSDGLHVVEDIPVLLGVPEDQVRKRLGEGRATWRNPTEKNGKQVWYSRAVGSDPLMVDVILELAQQVLTSSA